MIEDVYEPLRRYRDEFREDFSRRTAEAFDKLVEDAGIDAKANTETVEKIDGLKRLLASASARVSRLGCLFAALVVLIVAGVAAPVLVALDRETVPEISSDPGAVVFWVGLPAAVLAFLLLRLKVSPSRKNAAANKARIEQELQEETAKAWEQLAALNSLYDWDITARLISATVPRIEFDPFFTASRLDDLRMSYGWDDEYNRGKSVLFSQSGTINGNPFVFGKVLRMEWEQKTYTGYRTIHWTERVRDSNGKMMTVSRSQTLSASVQKPVPSYPVDSFLLYGNDAAPNLTFLRVPNGIAGAEKTVIGKMRKRSARNELRRFSRNLRDESQYTMLGNEDFETIFRTDNRNNEVEFRLLFTPVAQRQMLDLLRDREFSFGDDVTFKKTCRLNAIRSGRLDRFDLNTDPSRFRHYDLEAARRNFQEFNENYFQTVYFALAPLLSIPLYQQTRSQASLHPGLYRRKAEFWEHESIANHRGYKVFAHPECVTPCILKTASEDAGGGFTRVDVTAHGYRTEPRVEHERVFGGDGRFHDVEINWEEYLPVERTSGMYLSEDGEALDHPAETAPDRARHIQELLLGTADRRGNLYRRSIRSFME